MIYMLGATDSVPVGMDLIKQPSPSKVAESKSTKKFYITIDMKNMHVDPRVGNIYGRVYLAPPKQGKADCTISMSADTFERISRKESSVFRAFMTRKISMKGDLKTLLNFDSEVLSKYHVNTKAAQLV